MPPIRRYFFRCRKTNELKFLPESRKKYDLTADTTKLPINQPNSEKCSKSAVLLVIGPNWAILNIFRPLLRLRPLYR